MKQANVVGYSRHHEVIHLYVTRGHYISDNDCKGLRTDEVIAFASDLPHPEKIVGKDIKFYTTFTTRGTYENRYALTV